MRGANFDEAKFTEILEKGGLDVKLVENLKLFFAKGESQQATKLKDHLSKEGVIMSLEDVKMKLITPLVQEKLLEVRVVRDWY